jgi:hypothetical protein
MTKLEKIEQAIAELSPGEVRKLFDKLAEIHADQWDRQIEEDAKAGRLDAFIEEATREVAEGKMTPL